MAANGIKAAQLEPAPGEPTGGGKVRHDSRGTAIWDWDIATGVLAAIDSSDLLRKLDNPELEIEGRREPSSEWAGDPYNRR